MGPNGQGLSGPSSRSSGAGSPSLMGRRPSRSFMMLAINRALSSGIAALMAAPAGNSSMARLFGNRASKTHVHCRLKRLVPMRVVGVVGEPHDHGRGDAALAAGSFQEGARVEVRDLSRHRKPQPEEVQLRPDPAAGDQQVLVGADSNPCGCWPIRLCHHGVEDRLPVMPVKCLHPLIPDHGVNRNELRRCRAARCVAALHLTAVIIGRRVSRRSR